MLIGWFLKPQIDSRIQLYYKPSQFTDAVISRCPSLRGRFLPTFWLYNGMLQAFYEGTIGGTTGKSILCPEVSYTSEKVFLPDGGLMSIDWSGLDFSSPNPTKILIIGPGVTGHSDSQYIRCVAIEAMNKGYAVAVLHGRGIAGNEILVISTQTFKTHCACAFDDYGFAISYIQDKFPNIPLFGLGTSMGAGILLKHVALSGYSCKLKALVVVATPFSHSHAEQKANDCWPYFGIPRRFILNIFMTMSSTLKPQLEKWPDELEAQRIDFSQVSQSKSYSEFDSSFTAKINGFPDSDEYYAVASSAGHLHNVKIPVFALSSLDDPIISYEGIPFNEFLTNDNLILMTTNCGGHVGWFTGTFIPKRWYQIPCVEYLEAVLSTLNS